MFPRNILIKSALLFIVLVIPSLNARAQNNDSLQTKGPFDILRGGSNAFEFQLGSAISRRYSGFTISFKHQNSKTSDFRLGLSLGNSFSNETYEDIYKQDSTNYINKEDRDLNYQNVSILCQYIRYSSIKVPLRIYWGLGPRIGYTHISDNLTRSANDPNQSVEKTKETRYIISGGVEAALGAEWFATHRISLTAEYGFDFIYQYSHSKATTEVYSSSLKDTSSSVNFNLLDVLFGFSVYF